jgi:two-component system response regulator PilR (NtrC family)
MECIESYHWPGNVRELENVLERAVALEMGSLIEPESLPREVRQGKLRHGEIEVVLPESGIDLDRHLEALRRKYMLEAMERCGSVQTRAAEILGMTFRSFRYFAKKYGITGRDGSAAEVPAEALRAAVVEPAVAERRD